MFEVGNHVIIRSNGEVCPTYFNFCEENNVDNAYPFKRHFVPDDGETGVIIAIGKHSFYDEPHCLVNLDNKNLSIVISEIGLSLIE